MASIKEIASATKYAHVCKVQLAHRILLLSFFMSVIDKSNYRVLYKTLVCREQLTHIKMTFIQ